MTSYQSSEQPTKNWILYSYFALVAWLPIPLASNRPWGTSIAEVWCYIITASIIIIWMRNPQSLPTSFKTAKIALILLALNLVWLLIQCFPLPLSWIQILSPQAYYQYSQTGAINASISLDKSVSFNLFQEAAYLFSFFCLTLYLINSKQKLKWLIYTILLSALFQVIYGSLMALSGIEYSFFISKAALHSHIGSATGTFANRDHLAGYLEMALALGIGLMLTMLSDTNSGKKNWKKLIKNISGLLLGPKARLRIILILLCLGLVVTHSRGGNLGFFISLGVAGIIFLTLARNKPRATIIFLSSLIILDIIIIGSLVGVSKVMNRLAQTTIQTESRDDAYFATYPMVEDYFISGVGAGNYFNTFPTYKTPQLSHYWNHAHNDYLEIFVEFGFIGFSLLASVVCFSIITAIRILQNRRSPFALGMSFASLMGIVAILVHSTVDYNLQILANSSMFMIIIAIPFICYDITHQQRGRERR